ncbi:2,3-bisphosphoglycerate-dependent phosphoglycerate mutase [Georgenia sp. TF02-10]|uniref:2,3-bisphosphoglycerate-dependent phosphoglycerate mutase n=1 Tax=Georgenia sp. TF02-10 TaxID=2917725 RepID=UPI001FA7A745|nr:2,3-bisphosphoglycerate-dependent phosphoglycerate mutase [Georgenia sp. TF02-10]UNX54747.1 2,3-bisphosphoglycerate-dependent phosphoglycerate mutase [Georgenia sp. TF02-10]
MGSLGTVVLVRHGESVGNARGLFTGVLDVDLTPAGEAACHEAGLRLAGAGWRPDFIVTSELSRGWRTAELVAAQVGTDAPVLRTWRLNERSYGALSGYPKAEVLARYGPERFLHWRRSYTGRPPPLPAETLALWRRLSPFDRLPAEALTATESLADVVHRLRPWIADLAALVHAGRDVLVVAHGNSLRALCALLDDLTPAQLRELNLPNARPLRYDFADGDRLRPLVPGGRYLDPDLARAEALVIAREGGT